MNFIFHLVYHFIMVIFKEDVEFFPTLHRKKASHSKSSAMPFTFSA